MAEYTTSLDEPSNETTEWTPTQIPKHEITWENLSLAIFFCICIVITVVRPRIRRNGRQLSHKGCVPGGEHAGHTRGDHYQKTPLRYQLLRHVSRRRRLVGRGVRHATRGSTSFDG